MCERPATRLAGLHQRRHLGKRPPDAAPRRNHRVHGRRGVGRWFQERRQRRPGPELPDRLHRREDDRTGAQVPRSGAAGRPQLDDRPLQDRARPGPGLRQLRSGLRRLDVQLTGAPGGPSHRPDAGPPRPGHAPPDRAVRQLLHHHRHPHHRRGGAEPVHRPPAGGRDLRGPQHLHLLAGHALHDPRPRRGDPDGERPSRAGPLRLRALPRRRGQQHLVQRAPVVHRRHRRPVDHPELGRPSRSLHGRLPDAVPGGGTRQVDPVLPGDRKPRSLPHRVVPRPRGPVARVRRVVPRRHRLGDPGRPRPLASELSEDRQHGQPQEPGVSGVSGPELPGRVRRQFADRRDYRRRAGRGPRQPAEGGGRSRPPFPPQDGVDPGVLRHHVQSGRPRLRARRSGSTGGIRLLQLPARSGRAAQGDRPRRHPVGDRRLEGHPRARVPRRAPLGLAPGGARRRAGREPAHDHRCPHPHRRGGPWHPAWNGGTPRRTRMRSSRTPCR